MNQLKELKNDPLYSWGALPSDEYLRRLGILFGGFFGFIGSPIAFQTFDPLDQPLEFVLSASTGSFIVVAAAVVRIYLGWQYIGNRLLSAAVEYEETGWYDGQIFIKPPEVLARDRLLGTYEVKPILQGLQGTLVGSGAGLAVSAVVLSGLIAAGANADGVYGRAAGKGRIVSEMEVLGVAEEPEDAVRNALVSDTLARMGVGSMEEFCKIHSCPE